jgi:4-amino-4-deoxy-L-arabinose transferase-like glycosyltransferase
MMKKTRLDLWVLALVLAGSFLLSLASLDPDRFGKYQDDTLLVTTAKALAIGQGYRIISMPNDPLQVKYPPFYPFVLSLIWRVNPQFPENVTAMMLASILTTVSFLGLSWRYMVKEGYSSTWQALVIVAITAMNWRILVLGTTVYSEMLYALLSVGALSLAELYGKEQKGWPTGVASGVLIGLAFLTRTSGVVLLIAVALYYLLHKQSWRRFAPVLVGGMFVLVWLGWCFVYSPKPGSSGYYVSTSYIHDFYAVIAEEQGISNSSMLMAFLTIVATNFFMLILMSVPMVCLGLDYNWIQGSGGDLFLIKFGLIVFAFIFLAKGFIRQKSGGFRLLHLYVVSYLALHLVWPFTSYDRFLMPLLPFLLLFGIVELTALIYPLRKNLASGRLATVVSVAFIALVFTAVVGVALSGYGSGIRRSLASASLAKTTKPPTSGDAEAIQWVTSNTDTSDILVCYQDLLYYLYTGRKAVRSYLGRTNVSDEDPEAATSEQSKLALRIINDNDGRYLIVTKAECEDLPDVHRRSLEALLQAHPRRFVAVFESTDGQAKIYRITNDAR